MSSRIALLVLLAAMPATAAQSQVLPTSTALRGQGPPQRVRATPSGVAAEGNVLWDYTVLGRRSPGPGSPSTVPASHKALVKTFGANTVSSGFFQVGTTGTEWV